MDFGNVLQIDRWYKVPLYVGVVVLASSFFFEAKGVSNTTLQLLSGGVVLVTSGEWRAERRAYQRVPGGMESWLVRQPDAVSFTLQLLGEGCLKFRVSASSA